MNSYSEKMLNHLHSEELAEAQLMFVKAMKNDSEETLIILGEELLNLGFLEEAKQIFERIIEAFPEREEFNLPLAEIAIENNLIDEAFTYLEKISSVNESYAQSLLVSADLYQVIGVPEVSESKLKEAQYLLPNEPLILFALGELYFSNGQMKKAIEYYKKLLEENLSIVAKVSINERLGSCLSLSGEFESAIYFLEKALLQEQTDDRLFQLAYTYLQIDETQKAISLLRQLHALNPSYHALYLPFAKALQKEELLEEAQGIFLEGIKENPFQVELFHSAAENAYRLHDRQQSEELLQKALTIGEKTDETILTLSNLYLEEHRYEEAIEVAQRMEDKTHPYHLWNLAQAYNQLEDYKLARENYKEAYISLSHEPEFLKDYAIFLREEGAFEKAKEVIIQYTKYAPMDSDIESLLEGL